MKSKKTTKWLFRVESPELSRELSRGQALEKIISSLQRVRDSQKKISWLDWSRGARQRAVDATHRCGIRLARKGGLLRLGSALGKRRSFRGVGTRVGQAVDESDLARARECFRMLPLKKIDQLLPQFASQVESFACRTGAQETA